MELWISIFQFVGALVALIIVHELGHFIAARSFNVEVEEFGIGFPPRLLTLFTIWGTKFTLNAIPLGGFVRPKGENDPNIPGGLAHASPWVRLVVLVSGPLANLLVAAILYTTIFSRMGSPDTTQVQIVDIAADSPAAMADLQPGDLILTVNGQEVSSTNTLSSLIAANLGEPTTITYQRGAETGEITLVPRPNPPAGEGAIGIVMGNPTLSVGWFEALPAGTAAVYYHSKALLELPVNLIRGEVSPEEGRLVGFKGMFDIYQDVREGEVFPGTPRDVNIMFFFTNITISLGLLNLFPFPALDGGRILFTLPEILFRRRVPPEYEGVINLVGFGILIALLLYINLQDFISPVSLPR
jgi:regulator of sigma E protease